MSKDQSSQEIKPCHVQYSGQTQEKPWVVACRPGLVQEVHGIDFCLFKTKLSYTNAERTSSETPKAAANRSAGSEAGACNSRLQHYLCTTVKTDYN